MTLCKVSVCLPVIVIHRGILDDFGTNKSVMNVRSNNGSDFLCGFAFVHAGTERNGSAKTITLSVSFLAVFIGFLSENRLTLHVAASGFFVSHSHAMKLKRQPRFPKAGVKSNVFSVLTSPLRT